jgi:hypothetical protein
MYYYFHTMRLLLYRCQWFNHSITKGNLCKISTQDVFSWECYRRPMWKCCRCMHKCIYEAAYDDKKMLRSLLTFWQIIKLTILFFLIRSVPLLSTEDFNYHHYLIIKSWNFILSNTNSSWENWTFWLFVVLT